MSKRFENLRAIWQAGREDMRGSTLAEKSTLIGSMALLGAHEFGMEASLIYVGTQTYEQTGNPLAVSLALGSMSLATESVLTIGMSKSITTFDKVTEELEDRYYTTQIATPDKPKRKHKIIGAVDNTLLALTLGSPGVILRGYAKDPSKTYEENRKTGLRTAGALATFNATVTAGIIGGSAWLGEKLGTEVISDAIVEIGDSPITYGVIVAYVLGRTVSASRSNNRLREEHQAVLSNQN